MHITRIRGLNIKSTSFDQPVDPVTIFHGDNMVGKTSRLDCIRLALYGYLPRMASESGDPLPSRTFKLSGSALEMLAGITFSNGDVTEWKWTEHRGSIRVTPPDKTVSVPRILTDASGFFGLKTARKRIEYIFSNVSSHGKSGAEKLISDVKSIALEPASETARAVLSSTIADIDESIHNWKLQSADDPLLTFQVWLDSEIDRISDALTLEKANADRLLKAVQAQVQLGEHPARDISSAEQLRNRCSDEIATIDKALAVQQERMSSAQKSLKRRNELTELIAMIPSQSATTSDLEAAIELRRQHSLEIQRLDSAVQTARFNLSAARKRHNDWDNFSKTVASIQHEISQLPGTIRARDEKKSVVDSFVSRTPDLERDQFELRSELSRLNDAISNCKHIMASAQQRFDSLLQSGKCPTCHSQGQGFLDVITREWDSSKSKFDMEMEGLSPRYLSCQGRISEVSLRLDESKKQDESHRISECELRSLDKKVSDLQSLESKLNGILANPVERPSESVHDCAVSVSTLESQLSTEKEKSSTIDSNIESIKKSISDVQRRVKLESELAGIPNDTITVDESLPIQRAKWVKEFATADLEIKKAVAEKQQEISRKKLAFELDIANARLLVTKSVLSKIKETRDEMASSVFASLISGINRVVVPVLGHPLQYEDGNIFFVSSKGRRCDCEMFSGTEEAVVQAAVCLYLAQSSPVKLVLFDELGRLNKDRKLLLIKTVLELINEKVIDQFIGVDVDESPYLSCVGKDGFSLVHVQ